MNRYFNTLLALAMFLSISGKAFLASEAKSLAKIYYQHSFDIHQGNTYAIQVLRTLK